MILALDTATTVPSVALADPSGEVRAQYAFAPGEQPAAILFPVVQRLLDESGLPFTAVERVAVCCGPGSFTGIRIGLAAGEGLQLATGCSLLAVSTLTAWAVLSGGPVRVRVPDGGGGVAEQDLDAAGRPLSPVQGAETLPPLPADGLTAGPGWGMPPVPLAPAIAKAAALDLGTSQMIAPLYLRPSYAEVALQSASGSPR